MDTIVLRPELRETLEKHAQRESRDLNDLVNEAVSRYMREQQRRKIDREIAAYEAMHAKLRQEYLGQWIAVHDQELVDHDADVSALYRRVRARYGRTSVLIRKVTEQPVAEVWLRTPSTGKRAT